MKFRNFSRSTFGRSKFWPPPRNDITQVRGTASSWITFQVHVTAMVKVWRDKPVDQGSLSRLNSDQSIVSNSPDSQGNLISIYCVMNIILFIKFFSEAWIKNFVTAIFATIIHQTWRNKVFSHPLEEHLWCIWNLAANCSRTYIWVAFVTYSKRFAHVWQIQPAIITSWYFVPIIRPYSTRLLSRGTLYCRWDLKKYIDQNY